MATSIPPDKHAVHHHYAHRNTQNGDFEHSWRKALHEAQRGLTDPFTARGGAGGPSAAPAPMMASVSGRITTAYQVLKSWVLEHKEFVYQYYQTHKTPYWQDILLNGPAQVLIALQTAYDEWVKRQEEELKRQYDALPLPSSWAELKPQPVIIDGKTINSFQDWLSDNRDWYTQHADKDLPSYDTFMQMSRQMYLPYVESVRMNTDDAGNAKIESWEQEQGLLEINTNSDFHRQYDLYVANNKDWFQAHEGMDFPSLDDWIKFISNGYISLLEYIKDGGKINFGVSTATTDGNQPDSPSTLPDHGGELRKLTTIGNETSGSNTTNTTSDSPTLSGCALNLTVACGAKYRVGTVCGAATSSYGFNIGALTACGSALTVGLASFGASNVCAMALSVCGADSSMYTYSILKAKICGSNSTVGVACPAAGGLCGWNQSIAKWCGSDWSACGIRNSGLSISSSSYGTCGVATGDWCLLNLDSTISLIKNIYDRDWCYLNGALRR